MQDYPFVAQIDFPNAKCAGALIASTWVATAAQCVAGLDANNGRVIMGTNDNCFTEDGKECSHPTIMDIRSIVVHPLYNSCNERNSIALVELATPAQRTVGPDTTPFDPVNVSTTVFAAAASLNTAEKDARVFGWGTLADGSVPTALHMMPVEVLTRNEVEATNGASLSIGMLGARGRNVDQNVCEGDLGGPMYNEATNTLVGIVSSGNNCNTEGGVSIYADVALYHDWMAEYTKWPNRNNALEQVDLGNPDQDTGMCSSNVGMIVGIAVGTTVGVIVLILVVVYCFKHPEGQLFKGIVAGVRRTSQRFSFSKGRGDDEEQTAGGYGQSSRVAPAPSNGAAVPEAAMVPVQQSPARPGEHVLPPVRTWGTFEQPPQGPLQ